MGKKNKNNDNKTEPKTNKGFNIKKKFKNMNKIHPYNPNYEFSSSKANVSFRNQEYGANGSFRNQGYGANGSFRNQGYWANGSFRNQGYGAYSRYNLIHPENMRPFRRKPVKKQSSRPSSPVLGSEEYMVRKIQQTSAIIMEQLLNPEKQTLQSNTEKASENNHNQGESSGQLNYPDKPVETAKSKSKPKKITSYNIEEIQVKIMNHITNLNDGRKKNLINANSSGYDIAIQQIQKQKRLEISRALRNMCFQPQQAQQSSDFINSIIPDMGIKIEDLPRDLIEELRNTLNLNLESDFSSVDGISGDGTVAEFTIPDTGSAGGAEPGDDTRLEVDPSFTTELLHSVFIKHEPMDVADPFENVCEVENSSEPANDDQELHHEIVVKEEISCNKEENAGVVGCEQNLNSLANVDPLPDSNSIETCDNFIDINTDSSLSHDSSIPKLTSQHCLNTSTQTREKTIEVEAFFDTFFTKYYNQAPESISEAIGRMFEIDKFISKLTTYRQTLFHKFEKLDQPNHNDQLQSLPNEVTSSPKKKRKARKKQTESIPELVPLKMKSPDSDSKADEIRIKKEVDTETDDSNLKEIVEEVELKKEPQKILQLGKSREKMLVLKAVENNLVAATESGKIFFYALKDGHFLTVLAVSKLPITSLLFTKTDESNLQMYVGSLEKNLQIYDFNTRSLVQNVKIDESIQCMESNWGYIFIGSTQGSLLRYSISKKVFEYEDKLSGGSILVIKAALEGARRIVLIGSRNAPVCVRDAMTGLHLRTMSNIISPTTYCLIMEKNLVYCGTTVHDILVFSFHDGELAHILAATNSKGISCMKIYKNLLFASCHNGQVYVYDINTNKFIDHIKGPGGVIISMEVLENQVIIGTMCFKFKSLPIPQHILRHTSI